MAVAGGSRQDPMVRATRQLRRQVLDGVPDGWAEVRGSVTRRVLASVRPAVPVLVLGVPGDPTTAVRDDRGSQTRVSTRVLEDALRRLLRRDPTHAPERIEVVVVGERPTAVLVRLTCAYGCDLRVLGEEVRREVRALLEECVGTDPGVAPVEVAVEVVDVVVGDPRVV